MRIVSCSLLDPRLCYRKSKIFCCQGVPGGSDQAQSGDFGRTTQTVKAARLDDHARSEPGHGPEATIVKSAAPCTFARSCARNPPVGRELPAIIANDHPRPIKNSPTNTPRLSPGSVCDTALALEGGPAIENSKTGYCGPVAEVHPFLQQRGPIAFAHRGGTSVYPENSERAFRHAVDLGYSHIETDVQVTRDGVGVICHDDRLDRTTDRCGDIAELSWAEVSKAKIGGTEPILQVDELLEAFPNTRINFDPKRDGAVEPLARAISAADALDRVLVGAFSDRRVDHARRLLGDGLAVAAGSRRVMALLLRANHIPVPLERVDAAQVPVRMGRIEIVTPRFIEHAHTVGIHVHVWGVDDPGEMHRLLDLGVDGLMTDEPEVLKSVFSDRGIWEG